MTTAVRSTERDAIMRAAHRLVGHGDEPSTSIDSILRAAKVNRRVFYRHFASKDDLFIAMQDRAGALILDGLRAVVANADTPRNGVVAWIEDYLSIGWDGARLRDARTFLAPEVALARGSTSALEAVYRSHRRVLSDVLVDGLADGSLPRARPELDALAIHAVAVRHIELRIHGLADHSYDEVRDHVVTAFLTALMGTPPSYSLGVGDDPASPKASKPPKDSKP